MPCREHTGRSSPGSWGPTTKVSICLFLCLSVFLSLSLSLSFSVFLSLSLSLPLSFIAYWEEFARIMGADDNDFHRNRDLQNFKAFLSSNHLNIRSQCSKKALSLLHYVLWETFLLLKIFSWNNKYLNNSGFQFFSPKAPRGIGSENCET